MEEINKTELDSLVVNGKLPPTEINQLLENEYYHDKKDWINFLSRFFLGLGSSLMCAGVIFFFAFNWDDIHKFVKLGLVITLLLGCIGPVLFLNLKSLYKNILLTLSSVLIGVAFAVYGQIYQTGADAYDFFLGWTLFVTFWALSTRFSAMWLVFFTLTTITTALYFDQELNMYSEDLLMLVVVLKFAIIYAIIKGIEYVKKEDLFDRWFDNLLQIAIVYLISASITISLFSSFNTYYLTAIIGIGVVYYIYLFIKGLRLKNIVPVSIVPFSLMWIISTCLIKASDEIPMVIFLILLTAAFMIVFVNKLLTLLNIWKNEKA